MWQVIIDKCVMSNMQSYDKIMVNYVSLALLQIKCCMILWNMLGRQHCY